MGAVPGGRGVTVVTSSTSWWTTRRKRMTLSGTVALMSLSSGCSGSSDAVDVPNSVEAQEICEGFVTDRLEAPTSAEFLDQHAFSPEPNVWTVRGMVRALDGTGSKVRLTYQCTLKYLGDDKWRARDVEVHD